MAFGGNCTAFSQALATTQTQAGTGAAAAIARAQAASSCPATTTTTAGRRLLATAGEDVTPQMVLGLA